MQVHEFETRDEAMAFAHDTEGDKTLEKKDGKFILTVREYSEIQQTEIEGPDPVEEEQEEEQEEE